MNKLTTSILYSLFVDNLDKNWVFSPASYLEAMGNLSVCLKGDNLSELQAVAPLIGGEHAKGLETYNCLLHSAEYAPHLNKAVIDVLTARGADLKSFSGPEVIGQVNSIVTEKTHGLIKGLLSPDDYNDFLKFVILNCVYFKKDWYHEFDKPYQASPFNGKQTTQVKFLKKQARFHYYEDYIVDIAELPYKDSNVCCYVIVPKTSLFDVFSNLNQHIAKISQVKFGLDVNLWVPPFKTESTHDLEGPTKDAGVKRIWQEVTDDGPNQDWTLIDWNSNPPCDRMWVTFIKQKAYLDFNRKGTEAAAATAIGICAASGCCSLTIPEIKVIHADRPFLYVLADKNNHEPLFVGVVNDVPDSL